MIRNIEVVYDGSGEAEKGFELALDLAAKYQAVIAVLAVIVPGLPYDGVDTQTMMDSAAVYYLAQFQRLKLKTGRTPVPATFQVKTGHPVKQIVSLADTLPADLIVIGPAADGWLTIATAKRVLARTRCPVLIVR